MHLDFLNDKRVKDIEMRQRNIESGAKFAELNPVPNEVA